MLELKKLENVIIQKSDKGNSVVLLGKDIYVGKMKSILNDKQKFLEMNLTEKEMLKKLLQTQDKIKQCLDPLLRDKIVDDNTYNRLLPKGSQPGKMYGLCKVHKSSVDGCPPFRPILSAIGTPTYNIAKFLIPILEPITKNDFVIRDSFTFVEDVKKQNFDLFMASFDVEALFTNIPLEETIEICVDKLYTRRNMKIKGLSRIQFKNLLELATKESLFIFDGICYSQTDGVAMGSPLGPTLANIFLTHYEEIWLSKCPNQFKPKYYRRYVDDIFILFEDSNQVNKFEKFMNSRHKNINFTKEIETDNCLSFLDIRIERKVDKFETSIFRKPTFSGVYLNFKSHVPDTYKKGLVYCLLFRIYNLCSNWSIIHEEINKLKTILLHNKYPLNFINFCIKTFLDKCFDNRVQKENKTQTATQDEFIITLPFLGNVSNIIRKNLKKLFQDCYPNAKLKIVFKSGMKIGNMFKFKDTIPSHIRSLLVYQFKCSGCNATYIGKTKRHHKVRMSEHLGISFRTGEPTKFNIKTTTAIRDHIRESGHDNDFTNFEILSSGKNNLECLIKEKLLIQKLAPSLINKQVKNFKLGLF